VLARFVQATSNTRPAAPSRSSRARRASPTICSCSVRTTTPVARNSGSSSLPSTSRSVRASISAVAAPGRPLRAGGGPPYPSCAKSGSSPGSPRRRAPRRRSRRGNRTRPPRPRRCAPGHPAHFQEQITEGRGGKLVPPEALADHADGLGPWPVVVRPREPSHGRARTEHRPEVRRGPRDPRHEGLLGAEHRRGAGGVCGQGLEAPRLLAPIDEVRPGHRHRPASGVPLAHPDDVTRLLVGERLEEHVLHDREDRRVRPDPESEGQHPDQRELRSLEQRPEPIPHVLTNRIPHTHPPLHPICRSVIARHARATPSTSPNSRRPPVPPPRVTILVPPIHGPSTPGGPEAPGPRPRQCRARRSDPSPVRVPGVFTPWRLRAPAPSPPRSSPRRRRPARARPHPPA
jgi:hypothetical protein